MQLCAARPLPGCLLSLPPASLPPAWARAASLTCALPRQVAVHPGLLAMLCSTASRHFRGDSPTLLPHPPLAHPAASGAVAPRPMTHQPLQASHSPGTSHLKLPGPQIKGIACLLVVQGLSDSLAPKPGLFLSLLPSWAGPPHSWPAIQGQVSCEPGLRSPSGGLIIPGAPRLPDKVPPATRAAEQRTGVSGWRSWLSLPSPGL